MGMMFGSITKIWNWIDVDSVINLEKRSSKKLLAEKPVVLGKKSEEGINAHLTLKAAVAARCNVGRLATWLPSPAFIAYNFGVSIASYNSAIHNTQFRRTFFSNSHMLSLSRQTADGRILFFVPTKLGASSSVHAFRCETVQSLL